MFLGYVVATFSAGRFVSTIILGYVSNHFKYRSILLFCAGGEYNTTFDALINYSNIEKFFKLPCAVIFCILSLASTR